MSLLYVLTLSLICPCVSLSPRRGRNRLSTLTATISASPSPSPSPEPTPTPNPSPTPEPPTPTPEPPTPTPEFGTILNDEKRTLVRHVYAVINSAVDMDVTFVHRVAFLGESGGEVVITLTRLRPQLGATVCPVVSYFGYRFPSPSSYTYGGGHVVP